MANDLIRDSDFDQNTTSPTTNGCPYINMEINGKKMEMLIDSGAEISAISTEYENKLMIENEPQIPSLPLVGLNIYNAIGNTVTKASKQMLLPLTFDSYTVHTPFIVVPQLNEGGIIGNDFLEKNKAILDFKNQTMIIKNTITDISIPFNDKTKGSAANLKSIHTKIMTEPMSPKTLNLRSTNEQKFIDHIVDQFPEVFRETPGKIRGYQCSLRLKNDKPICVRPYPIPVAKIEAVEKELNRMIELDIIERSRSQYSIPIVPVFKKNGEVRLCLDARKINEVIVPDCERPLTIDTILAKFKKVKCISTLDLRSGYWQVPLAKESRAPCSFLINGRNYSYKRLPFGLNVSGAEFQKSMDTVLGPLIHDYVTIYVDDILITSENEEQHYEHIKTVLERLRKFNVTVNLEKCQFFRQEASFLGHIITTKGIKMETEKVESIQQFKTPSSKKELQQYLGFLNFYRRYIKKFAHIVEPMIELLRKNQPWSWKKTHQDAFENSKHAFIKEVETAFPDFTLPLYINSDASNKAIGGELFQIVNGERKTIGYASRTLKPAETRYTTTEIEALAILYCCSKFRQYLIGHKIIIQTDHHALTFIKQCKLTSGRLTRWVLALQEFNFTIEHIPGKLNVAADTLTRYPRTDENRIETKIRINKINGNPFSKELTMMLKNIAKEQEKDKHIYKLKEKETEHTTTKDNIIFIRGNKDETWQLALPSHVAEMLIIETHTQNGHPGRYKTHHALKEFCTFNNMHRKVALAIKSCDLCQKSKPLNYATKGRMTAHKPSRKLEKVSVDLMGPLPTGRGGTHYILAILDIFTKYIRLYALKRATTRSILNKIIKDYIPKTGKPDAILSDNGTQFTSKSWINKLATMGINTNFTTKYHPQSNPVERYNREIGRLLRTHCHDQHTKWPNFLDRIEYWLNRLRSEVTETTPVQAFKGTRPEHPLEKLIHFPPQPKEEENDRLLCKIANRIRTKAQKRENKYNQNRKFLKFKVGDKILTKNHHLSNAEAHEIKKLFSLFEGPFVIKKVISDTTLAIFNDKTCKEELVNVAEVRPYFEIGHKTPE